MAAPVAISKTLDLAQTAREARLLRVASRKKTTSNAYRSGAKNYKVSLTNPFEPGVTSKAGRT